MTLYWAGAVTLVTFAVTLWICWGIVSDYVLSADDLALAATSTPLGGPVRPQTWFTEGYHFLYLSYPEWYTPPTDYLRPGANATFWLFYSAFGTQHWSLMLVLGYLLYALTAGITCVLAVRTLKLGPWPAALATLIAMANPAMWATNTSFYLIPELLQFPVYQTEILCALLMMLAMAAFIDQRFVLFAVLTSVAIFTKETALTIPVCALVLVGNWQVKGDSRRTLGNLCLLVLPLLLWALARKFVLQHSTSIDVLPEGLRWFVRPLRNLLYLPTTLYRHAIGETLGALHDHAYGTVALDGLFLLVNLAWGIVLLYALARVVADWKLLRAPAPWVTVILFAVGNLAFILPLETGEEVRYLFFWFAVGPAALFAALDWPRLQKAIAATLTAGLLLPAAALAHSALSAERMQDYHMVKHSARSIVALLKSLPPAVKVAYVADDVAVRTSLPRFLAEYAGFNGRLVFVNNLGRLLDCQPHPEAERYHLERQADSVRLQVQMPACFDLPWNIPTLDMFGPPPDNTLPRGMLTYRFPEMRRGQLPHDYDIGQHWEVTFRDPACRIEGACVWIGLDAAAGSYFIIGTEAEAAAAQ